MKSLYYSPENGDIRKELTMKGLKITVAKPTADMLHKAANEAGIPIGEVVDRLVLNVAPNDPDSAFIIALEQYLICVSRLSKKDSAKVFGNMCGIFLGSIPSEELDDIVSSIKSTRNWENPAQEPITETEMAELRNAINSLLHSKGNEHSRQILYTFLHG